MIRHAGLRFLANKFLLLCPHRGRCFFHPVGGRRGPNYRLKCPCQAENTADCSCPDACAGQNPVVSLTQRDHCPPFITADGSEIRELMAYRNAPDIRKQSLAEATLHPGAATTEHYHPLAEEIYYIPVSYTHLTLPTILRV